MTERYAAARKHLRDADPVLARLIDKHPNFDPRAWMAELPKMDAYGALVFQIVGQQLSVRATRAILARLEALFGGHLPEPQEVLDADPEGLRRAGMSRRKVETLRALAERFASGELSDQTFLQSSDEEIEAALTAIPGIGPWTVHGFLIIALDRPDVVLSGDLPPAFIKLDFSSRNEGQRPSARPHHRLAPVRDQPLNCPRRMRAQRVRTTLAGTSP